MTTEQIPTYPGDVSAYEQQVKIRVGAGTAIKIGFFAAFGAMLFSILVSFVIGILAVIFGAAMIPVIRDILGF
jgi:hypothetical protein